MGRRLPDRVKIGRKYIQAWDKVLGPIAQRHPISENIPIHRYVHDNGTKLNYENQSREKNMDFLLSFEFNGQGRIIYARQVAPYFQEGEHHLNIGVCSELLPLIQDTANALELDASIDYRGNFGMKPGLSFGGGFEAEKFKDIAKFVDMTDAIIDFKILSVDKTMQRPFHYVLTFSQDNQRKGCRYFKEINSIEDLTDAQKVFISRKMLPFGLTSSKDAMKFPDEHIQRISEEYKGKIMCVDDFVKSK